MSGLAKHSCDTPRWPRSTSKTCSEQAAWKPCPWIAWYRVSSEKRSASNCPCEAPPLRPPALLLLLLLLLLLQLLLLLLLLLLLPPPPCSSSGSESDPPSSI